MKKSLIATAAAAALCVVMAGNAHAGKIINVKVHGLVCDFCARAVTKVFGKQDAVENVHVDLDNGEIHVTLKPGADLSDEKVADLVKKSGYDLVSIGRDAA